MPRELGCDMERGDRGLARQALLAWGRGRPRPFEVRGAAPTQVPDTQTRPPTNTQETKTALSHTRLRGQRGAHTRTHRAGREGLKPATRPARSPARGAPKLSAPAPRRRALPAPPIGGSGRTRAPCVAPRLPRRTGGSGRPSPSQSRASPSRLACRGPVSPGRRGSSPSCTAWNGLLASMTLMEYVIFSLCRMSSLRLRSDTASWNTLSSLAAFSSKMAPGGEEGSRPGLKRSSPSPPHPHPRLGPRVRALAG